jgi:type I restriction enzyme, S subunit
VKTKLVPSAWIEKDGRRLDCGPYLSGAIEAKLLLEKLPVQKQPLCKLTLGGREGVFHAGRESRRWVEDPAFGVPFLSSSDVLVTDLSRAPLISRKQITANPKFVLHKGWTLITRSGTIGRMVYCRPDMEGYACSEHVLRVVPDDSQILPGYLYAFLASRYGVPMVVGGTYGAIIQHIEPEHIWNLPVPRLGDEPELGVHKLIEEAAARRARATELIGRVSALLLNRLGLPEPKPMPKYSRPGISMQLASRVLKRFDAYYYASWNEEARKAFDMVPAERRACLGDVTEDVFIPGFFKRIYASDPKFGFPYLTGGDVYELSPSSEWYLSRRVPEVDRLILRARMVLVQDSGQLGGLIGRPVLVGRHLDGFACTNNMVRIVARTRIDQGFIFAVLNSEYGVRLLMREATGSSIPHLEENRIRRLVIPWPEPSLRKEIGEIAIKAQELRDSACELEAKGIELIRQTIEEIE